jgi:transposase, IS30 family
MSHRSSFTHLSAQERKAIEFGLLEGLSLAQIASSLGRARSTVWRELRRHTACAPAKPQVPAGLLANSLAAAQLSRVAVLPDTSARSSGDAPADAHSLHTLAGSLIDQPVLGGAPSRSAVRAARTYCSLQAQAQAQLRRSRCLRPHKLKPGSVLWEQLLRCLRSGLSPAHASVILGAMLPHAQLSHQCIYDTFYAMPRGELRSEVLALLPRGKKTRAPRGEGRQGLFLGASGIEERPLEVEQREVPGHWEGDLIKGARNASQIGTLIERSTLFVALVRVPRATAAATAEAFAGVLKRIDAQHRLSLTYDRGSEMAHHAHLSRQTGMKVYFAHPHSPWERGLNENMNAHLRRYFPKGRDLSRYTQDELDEVALLINAKPRKCLANRCPADLFLPPGSFDFKAYWAKKLNIDLSVASQG